MLPLLLLLLACKGPPPAGSAPAGPTQLGVEDVVTVQAGTISAGPRISGTLEPAEKAVLRAEAAGSVESVRAEVGEAVTRGQQLARIEALAANSAVASARAGVEAAEQDVALAERQLERAKRLVAAGALAAHDQELAELGVTSAKARLKAAQAQAAAAGQQAGGAMVTAPFDGVVAERSVNQGDVVAPGAPLFTIIDRSSLRLSGSVPAEAVALLAEGRPVRFTVQGYEGRSFDGAVERVAPAVDPTTRQLPVLVTLPNPDGVLVAGLFAEGRVAAEAKEGIVLPAAALAADGSVHRVKDGKVEVVTVRVGLRDEAAETVEVSGLAAGDAVLVGPAREIPAGTAVSLPKAGG